jgi:class 3 adenylate cyclase
MADDSAPIAAPALTVLFADISGSTLMYAVRGNEAAYTLTSTCLGLLEEQVHRLGGAVVKRVGDAILARFEDAEAAVRAAAGMQHALEAPDCPVRGEGLHVRTGIATGTALLDAGDVYGDVVNVAARLVALAGADEILLAGETYDALSEDLREPTRLIDQLALRGRPDWVLVYEYLWKREDTTVSAGDRTRARGYLTGIEVSYGARSFALGPDRPKLTIGRDEANDVAIAEEVVSRHHADIVLRGDKFVLIDRSTNGTYVLTDGGDVMRLRREEMTLAGSGRIVPGRTTLQPIRYRVSPR